MATFRTFVLGIAGFLLFGILSAWVLKSVKLDDTEKKRAEARMKNLAELRKSDGETLNSEKYIWIDKTKGTVRLPIDRADCPRG